MTEWGRGWAGEPGCRGLSPSCGRLDSLPYSPRLRLLPCKMGVNHLSVCCQSHRCPEGSLAWSVDLRTLSLSFITHWHRLPFGPPRVHEFHSVLPSAWAGSRNPSWAFSPAGGAGGRLQPPAGAFAETGPSSPPSGGRAGAGPHEWAVTQGRVCVCAGECHSCSGTCVCLPRAAGGQGVGWRDGYPARLGMRVGWPCPELPVIACKSLALWRMRLGGP